MYTKQIPDKIRRQAVPKRQQRITELIQTNVSTSVGIKAIKQRSPRSKKRPETAELVETDGTRAVCVEHADHKPHRDGVERGPVAVDEGGGELGLGELASAYGTESVNVHDGLGRVTLYIRQAYQSYPPP